MQKVVAGVVGSLVALVGFATTASASVSVSLVWASSGTSTTSGLAPSSSVTLNIVLANNGPLVSQGGGVL